MFAGLSSRTIFRWGGDCMLQGTINRDQPREAADTLDQRVEPQDHGRYLAPLKAHSSLISKGRAPLPTGLL